MYSSSSATAHIYALSQSTQPANTQTLHSANASQSGGPLVHQPATWGFLFSPFNGEFHSLSASLITIGRSENCSIVVADEKISGVHCVITKEASPHYTSDLFASPSYASSPASSSFHNNDGDKRSTASPFVYYLEDRSMNGTFLDGEKLGKGVKRQINPGSVICLVAISSKRSRTAAGVVPVSNLATVSSSSSVISPKVTRYVVSFEFSVYKEQHLGSTAHTAMSEASTAVATPASTAFPAEPYNKANTPSHLQNNDFGRALSPSRSGSSGATPHPRPYQNTVNRPVPLGLAPSAAALLQSAAARDRNGGVGLSSRSKSLSVLAHSRPKVLSWQWGQCVGSGSFAEVYIGIDTETARMIAIKRMKASIGGGFAPSLSDLNDAYSATLNDWGVDQTNMFDPNNPSSPNSQLNRGGVGGNDGLAPKSDVSFGSSGESTRVLARCDSSNDDILIPKMNYATSATDDGRSPTDPTATTLPMVSQAVLARESTRVDEYQGLSPEQHAEVELLKSLSHRSVVHYYGFAVVDNHLCILLEFVAGGSLVSLLKKFGAFQESVVRIYTTQALQGLEYLHDNGVVHGDIKPGNFLVSDSGQVKLSDFGTGRIVSSATKASRDSKKVAAGQALAVTEPAFLAREETVSPSTQLMGTPAFMSPEMVKGNKSTFSSDVWALGCTVIELFTGKAPWSELKLGDNPYALLYQIGTREEKPSFHHLFEKGASEALINFLEWCFVQNPEERPTAADLLTHPFIAPDSKVPLALWRPATLGGPIPTPPPSVHSYLSSSQQSFGSNTPNRAAGGGGGGAIRPSPSADLLDNATGLVDTPRGLWASNGGENSSDAITLPQLAVPPITTPSAVVRSLLTPMSQLQQQYSSVNVAAASQHATGSISPQEVREELKRQLTVTGELIGQHQQYLHSLAKNALKKIPSVAAPNTATHAKQSAEKGSADTSANNDNAESAQEGVASSNATKARKGDDNDNESDQPSTSASVAVMNRNRAPLEILPPSQRPGRLSSQGLGGPIPMGSEFPSFPANLFMLSSPTAANDANVHIAGQGGENSDEDGNTQRLSAAAGMREGRARDHTDVEGGMHTGLTTKLRRIELNPQKD